jgi:formate transporter
MLHTQADGTGSLISGKTAIEELVVKGKNPKVMNYEPALSTQELVKRISLLGIKKANTKVWQLIILGMLAGVYIGFGGHVFLVALEQGMGKIMAGAVFSVGLILVVIAGAELFTGNIMMVVSTVLSLYSVTKTLKNWISVYLGNFIGSLILASIVWNTGLLGHAGALNGLGQTAVKVCDAKLALPFFEAFLRGVLCNILVILAIIMATISKDIISKMLCCLLPVMVFVASGFEHCVANMYLIPLGLMAKGIGGSGLTQMFTNIVPVTLGNIVGGLLIITIHPNRIRQFIYILRNKSTFAGEDM